MVGTSNQSVPEMAIESCYNWFTLEATKDLMIPPEFPGLQVFENSLGVEKTPTL